MEPQIVDYYNEMPSGINVIDKMNEELVELQKEKDILKKKLESYEKIKDITNIKIDNFHNNIEKFCLINNYDVCDEDIIYKMMLKGYSFIEIPPSRVKKGLAELRYYHSNGNHIESKIIISKDWLLCSNCETGFSQTCSDCERQDEIGWEKLEESD